MDTRPIGIFDSGSGGLTIWKAITALLPHESTIYLGDHKHIPYGEKSAGFIKKRAVTCIQFLISKNVKLVVVACNAATTAGIDDYRKTFPGIPIIGVVPVIKTAQSCSKTKTFLVLSTPSTQKSAYQKHLIDRYASGSTVYTIGNAALVTLIENGKKDARETRELIESLLIPYRSKHVDVVVLGCTHFPFLRSTIQNIMVPNVTVLDSGDAVARHVGHVLDHEDHMAPLQDPTYAFFTTGNPEQVSKIASNLLELPIVVQHVIK